MPAEPALLVADAGPLIALSVAELLSLLPRLFGRVLIPVQVRAEIAAPPGNRPGAAAVLAASWLELASPAEPEPFLAGALDVGEASVLALARTMPGATVLMDELKGRRIAATAYHLPVIGSAGVLVRAKQAGLLPEIGPALRRMRDNGYFLADRLVAEALRAVGE